MSVRRIPLAWLSLMHERKRLAVSLTGVGFAVLLMFIEMGFLNGVYDAQTSLVGVLDADLVLINRLKEDVLPTLPFSRRRLEQARAVPGVTSAEPIYLEEFRAGYKSFAPDQLAGIIVLAFRPAASVLNLPAVKAQADLLYLPDTALADDQSRPLFGELQRGVRAELNGRTLTLVGTFSLGTNYRTDGLLIMSEQNFFRYFPDPDSGLGDPDKVEIGLLKLAFGADMRAVIADLERLLPNDVVVLTPVDFAARIKSFWQKFQPIGAVFGLGAAVGFLIGIAICYQILYTDITDHLAQYATLKALGYGNHFLVGLVTRKALWLALGGFSCGLLLSRAVYAVLQAYSGIPMTLTVERALIVLVLSVLMCVLSGLLAVRRALGLDPAELF